MIILRLLFELSFNTLFVIFVEYTLIFIALLSSKIGGFKYAIHLGYIFFCSGVNLYLMVLCWMNTVIIIFCCLQNFYLCLSFSGF